VCHDFGYIGQMVSPNQHVDVPGQRSGLDSPGAPDLDQPFDAESLYALRSTIAAHAERLGIIEEQADAVLIVASELATNAIRHGSGAGRVRLWLRGGALYCRVTDTGPGIADHTVGTTVPDVVGTGGRGMWICRQLCDEVIIEPGRDADGATGNGAAVTAVMTVDAQPG
jgi:anti-sigma regulatory factor (Ser/Thr protein kinase)